MRHAVDRLVAPDTADDGSSIRLEYPMRARIRYGYGEPAHPGIQALLDAGQERFADVLRSFLPVIPDLLKIPTEPTGPGEPHWSNTWFPGLDAAALYSLLATRDPRRYVEVGSGNSTTFARRAVRDHGLRTEITSIDPEPRAEIDALCDTVVRAPLESADLSVFDTLEAGDVCFFDGSHYCLQNSDVTVAFLDVLPRLPAGVLVHFHDIFLPWDYPPQFLGRWYSEQYLLAATLLAGNRLDVLLPNFYVTRTPALHQLLNDLWVEFTWCGLQVNGLSFWAVTREVVSGPGPNGVIPTTPVK